MVDLGGDVVLEESIIEPVKPPFETSWLEFHTQHALQIIESGRATGSSVVFRIVQPNKIFYITSLSITGVNGTATDSQVIIQILGTQSVTLLACNLIAGGNNSASITFPMPVRLEEGSQLQLNSTLNDASQVYDGMVTGFEIDKQITP